jgi:hypothetical protein
MNSLPPQYAFTFASLEACEAARGKVLAVPHVADVSRCAGERDHRLSVTLLFSATQEEGDDVRRLVAAVGGQTGALGPSGREWRAFLVDEMDAAACARLRLALEGRAHVEHLGECHAMPREYPPLAEPPGNETGLWSFHGYFTSQGMRYDATVAACEAVGIEAAQCNMPAPWPPQFGFHFDGRAECEPARARVLELPFVTGVGPCQPGDAWP